MEKTISEKIKLLRSGVLSEKEFYKFLENFPYKNFGGIKIDFHRKIRRGLPEVIYGKGKSVEQLKELIKEYNKVKEDLIITRIDADKFKKLKNSFKNIIYHEKARIITFDKKPVVRFKGSILILSGGSSDEQVAEEAYVSALYLGSRVDKEYDVGVACISRVIDLKEKLNDYTVIIVVAGMEGALPSVVAGLTSTPVIAVPTSIGYGANFEGLSALLTMLNSCAGGVSVVNIDNGFGAAFQATLFNQKVSQSLKK